MANSIGLIDAGYRGNIQAKIRNLNPYGKDLDSGSYFQIVSPDLKPIKVVIVNNLSETQRGDGSFGSTNK
jgi:dUTP pyrophosphatase